MFQLKKKLKKKNLDVCQLQACPMQVVIKKMQNSQNKQKKESITHLYGVSRPQLMDEIRAIDSLLFLFSFTAAKKRKKKTKTRKKERENRPTRRYSAFSIFLSTINVCATLFLIILLFFSPFFFPIFPFRLPFDDEPLTQITTCTYKKKKYLILCRV